MVLSTAAITRVQGGSQWGLLQKQKGLRERCPLRSLFLFSFALVLNAETLFEAVDAQVITASSYLGWIPSFIFVHLTLVLIISACDLAYAASQPDLTGVGTPEYTIAIVVYHNAHKNATVFPALYRKPVKICPAGRTG